MQHYITLMTLVRKTFYLPIKKFDDIYDDLKRSNLTICAGQKKKEKKFRFIRLTHSILLNIKIIIFLLPYVSGLK